MAERRTSHSLPWRQLGARQVNLLLELAIVAAIATGLTSWAVGTGWSRWWKTAALVEAQARHRHAADRLQLADGEQPLALRHGATVPVHLRASPADGSVIRRDITSPAGFGVRVNRTVRVPVYGA